MTQNRLSRRAFIRIFTLTGIGAGLAVLNKVTQPVGPTNFLRWKVRGLYEQSLAKPALVALAECPSYQVDLLSNLRDLWKQAEMRDIHGKKILIKPNLVDSIDGHPATTSPEVVGALVDLLKELGAARIVVGDGPAFRRDALPVAKETGFFDVLAKRGLEFIDLNYDDPQPVSTRDGWFKGRKALWLPKQVREADFIVSVPKLKTHHWGGVSLSMKNLLGVVPGCRYGWPKNILHFNGLTSSIVGIHQVLPPILAVVDGIIGMEGDGPLFGTPVQHGLLAVGKDNVAVDVICSRLMGYTLDQVDHLFMASWAGIGQAIHIQTRGASMERLQRQYQKPPSM